MSDLELRLGDCIEGLSALVADSVGVTITDAPFDSRTHRAALEHRSTVRRRVSKALSFPPLGPDEVRAVSRQIVRVTRRWILVFVAERQQELWATELESSGARFVRFGQAVRTNPRPQFTGDRPGVGSDSIVIAHRVGLEKQRWNGGGKAGVWNSAPARWDTGRANVHPTQKPEALMRELVADFTDAQELVCDPFAGSATTGVACAELGRRFIGWERDPRFHAIGAQRLIDAQKQLRLVG